MGRRICVALIVGMLGACALEPSPPPEAEPIEPPTPPPARLSIAEIQDVPRMSAGQTAILGSYQVTVRGVRIQGGRVEVDLEAQRGTLEEIERQKGFNPLFLSASQEAGFGLLLLAVEGSAPGPPTLWVVHPSNSEPGPCGAGGGEPPGWAAAGACRFELPPDVAPAYLLLRQFRMGGSLLVPIPIGGVGGEALIPLAPLPPALAGRVRDFPLPPGRPLPLDGLEVTLLDARVVREALPVVDESTGSIIAQGPWAEGWVWVVVRLQARCMRPSGCEAGVSLESPDARTVPMLVGPASGPADPRALPEGTFWDPEGPVLYREHRGPALQLAGGEEAIRALAFSVQEPAARWRIMPVSAVVGETVAVGFLEVAAEAP
ncbi:MAG: hypothetical protein RMM07_05255 [Anaerolineae bacterium]|nr:hypothetical protein [Anaerolineae bacterium]